MTTLSEDTLILLKRIKVLADQIDKYKNDKDYALVDPMNPLYDLLYDESKSNIIEAVEPTSYPNKLLTNSSSGIFPTKTYPFKKLIKENIMSDYIIKNAKYSYTKDGLVLSGNFYRESWIFNGIQMEVKVEPTDEDNIFIGEYNTVFEVQ